MMSFFENTSTLAILRLFTKVHFNEMMEVFKKNFGFKNTVHDTKTSDSVFCLFNKSR